MWYKSWIEVRWRLVLMTLLNTFFTVLLLDDRVSTDVWRHRVGGNLPMVFAMNAIVLAGSGLASQLSQRPGQVVHPSMLFLLSLPITRSRLVLVREAVGALSVVALMFTTMIVFCIAAPELRGIVPLSRVPLLIACITSVVLAVYAISALLSTVLDQLWQTYAALAIAASVLGLFPATRIWNAALGTPTSAAEPELALAVIVAGLSACWALTTVLVCASVRIVQRKQF